MKPRPIKKYGIIQVQLKTTKTETEGKMYEMCSSAGAVDV
jgi:hypothetical protein